MVFQQQQHGWLTVVVTTQEEASAKQVRAERDRQYGNIFQEEDTDARWVGDLAESVFDAWLKHQGINDATWVLDNAAGKPDFITSAGTRIGVKAVKRKVAPRPDYTAQITASHTKEPTDQFFFMTYEIEARRMWLLGGIDRDRFLQDARYYGPGEQVHANYTVRPGHEIYNIEIARLIGPADWIKQIA